MQPKTTLANREATMLRYLFFAAVLAVLTWNAVEPLASRLP